MNYPGAEHRGISNKMDNRMLVSVIVPVYNHERFIIDCLLSLFDQTWPLVELIVIDDLSHDDSFKMAEAFLKRVWVKERFSRIVVERNTINLGAPSTINKGIGKSTGDLIMIVNSDDLYSPARVECCVEEARRGHEVMFSDVEIIGDDGKRVFGPDAWRFRAIVAEIGRFPTVSSAFISMNRAISTGNFCFTRRIFEKVGPFKQLSYCHDWDFVLAATLHSEPKFIKQKLYRYRLHGTNSFRSLSSVAEIESRSCVERYFNAVVTSSLTNCDLRRIIKSSALWEGLIARSGSVIAEEWKRAREGRAPRHMSPRPSLGHSPASAVGSEHEKQRLESTSFVSYSATFEALGSRFSESIFLASFSGEAYQDGWIGEEANFHLRAVEATRRITGHFFLPESHESRLLVVAIRCEQKNLNERSVQLISGQVSLVHLEVDVAQRDFEFCVSVGPTHSAPYDKRRLGAVLVRVDA